LTARAGLDCLGQPAPPRARLKGFEVAGRQFPRHHQACRRLDHLGNEPLAAVALVLEVSLGQQRTLALHKRSGHG
jgi:hypothetical protein